MKRLILMLPFLSVFIGNVFADGFAPGSILITEIMANPEGSTDFPATRYVEIFNDSGSPINLKDWLLVSEDGSYTLPETILNDGQYAVLYEDALPVYIDAGGLAVPMTSFPSNLTSLRIEDPDGIVIDAVTIAVPAPARSFERDTDGTFYLSNDPRGGTPGSVNSLPPEPPQPPTDDYALGDMLINEIMVNPAVSSELGDAEFIELYNYTSSAINLKDWTFIYNISETSRTVVTLPDISLPAGGYAVLYRATKSLTVDPDGIAIPVANFPSSLANTGRLLELKSPKDVLIDAVTYPNSTNFAGTAWERDSDGAFRLSNNLRGGTPGTMNSVDNTRFGDVWINEIMVNPTGAAGLPETKYIELFNSSNGDISLRGWAFIYNASATSRTVVSLPGVLLPAGGYAVIYRTGEVIDTDASSIVIAVDNFPSVMANTGRLLELKNSDEILIDSVTYQNSTNYAGSSWERDASGNYYPSNDPHGGTPGAINSSDHTLSGDVVISEIMVNPGSSLIFGDAEYIELHNVTTSEINLRGWSFVYHASASTSTVVTLPGIVLPAGGYAVLYRTGDNLVTDAGGIEISVANFPATLAKDGRWLELKNSIGVLIDDVTYPNSTELPGSSWERAADGNYYPSNDPRGGTPGSKNSSDSSGYKDVWINEIMVNPTGVTALPETEYIELYNPSSAVINLNGWTLVYDSRTVVTLPGVMLPAGGYAVIYREGRNITVDPGGIPVPVANFPAALADEGRLLELKNSTNVLIDAVTYNDASDIPGCSWERDATGNYFPSNDPRGGTPGSVNSSDNSRFGNVWINEIMANPTGANTLPETEYIELINRTSAAINLRGWKLTYDSRTVVTLPGVILPAGGYAVLYREGRTIFIETGGLAIPVPNFPSSLADDGRTLELSNSRGVLIDAVTYGDSDQLPGISWERAVTGEFYPSNDPRGGTPGAVNSRDDSRAGDILINEVMANPTGATLLPETEYIELYNASGADIYLNGWTFVYDSKTVVSLPGVRLPAGSYAVLYREVNDILIDNGGIAIPVANFPSSLANDGRLVEIKNSREILIDAVTYPATASLSGFSWERTADSDFYPSADPRGGTPGSANSVDNSRFGNVMINEVMANPQGAALPETDYVELYNTTTSAMNLRGWSLIYHASATSSTVVTLPGIILPSGGYGLIYRTGNEIVIDVGGIALPVSNFPASLANEGRLLELKNSKDILIDSITYLNSTNFAGRSWERDRAGNLYLSNDPRGGTPGSVNSLNDLPPGPDDTKYGDVRLNEVMADPSGLTDFPETEYIEFYNASEANINLNGWTFIYDERTIVALPAVILPVNAYAVLYRSGKEIHIDNGGIAIPVANFPATLANTGRKLELTNSLNILIDSISYITSTPARSWERDAEGLLYLSTDRRGGTPGSVNSPKMPVIEPGDVQFGDIRINEIMANPTGSSVFPETEYIELYNTSQSDISLRGWSFIYDTRTIALPQVTLPVNAFAVLYRSGNEMHIDDGGIAIPMATFPASLSNTGSYLALTDPLGFQIDTISYPATQAAWAWERDTDGSLYLSYDPRGGTPGSANSQRSKPEDPSEETLFVNENEWIINELLPEEFPGGSEYIELYNHSDRTLYLAGLSIATRGADGELNTHYPLSSISTSFQPGEYIVLTSNRAGVLDFYYTPAPDRIFEVRLPPLNNSESTVVLFRTDDEIAIDEVSYSSKWHDQGIKNLKGVALERISPDAETQNPMNWTSATSTVGYGTPGFINSQNRSPDAAESIHVGIPVYDAGFGNYLIQYQLDKNGYHSRMEVYTIEGKKVAEITNNQLLGFEGEIRWNGLGMDGSRLPAGLYVFYAEIFHPAGQRKSFKNVFLVKP
ncbi:MAG: lamin tail domain-containing protein [Tannerella sp.]|jgi:hypothetical protein|nr:lamin tail domain-containing protein [Tannerella sp.]